MRKLNQSLNRIELTQKQIDALCLLSQRFNTFVSKEKADGEHCTFSPRIELEDLVNTQHICFLDIDYYANEGHPAEMLAVYGRLHFNEEQFIHFKHKSVVLEYLNYALYWLNETPYITLKQISGFLHNDDLIEKIETFKILKDVGPELFKFPKF